MELSAGLIIRCLVLEIEREARRAIELKSGWLVRVGNRKTCIDSRAVKTDVGRKAILVASRRRHGLDPDRVCKIPLLPPYLRSGHDITEAPTIDLAVNRHGSNAYVGCKFDVTDRHGDR